MVIGSGGAGKSTFARTLGEALHRPVHHLDTLYWRPGWVEPDKEDFRRALEGLCAEETWILDGNYGGTLDLRLAAADTIVFLDLPRVLCLFRVLKRAFIYRGRSRPDMTSGCPERINRQFLSWIWNYPRASRPGILRQLETLAARKEVIVLSSTAQVKDFVGRLRGEH